MTLEEAIKHARDTAENRTDLCEECRAEHEQLAEWLEQLVKLTVENEDLKAIAEQYQKQFEEAKSDTVREMQERLKAYFGTYVLGYKIPLSEALKAINQIAKEMLEGET